MRAAARLTPIAARTQDRCSCGRGSRRRGYGRSTPSRPMTRGCRTRSAEAACFPRPPVGVTRLASAAMPSEVLETKEPMPPTGLVTKPITPCAAPFQKPACPPSIAPRIGSSTIPATPPSIPSPNARMPTRKPSPALPTAACWTRARRSLYHGSRESAPDTLDTPPAKLETRVSAPAAVPPATPPAKERRKDPARDVLKHSRRVAESVEATEYAVQLLHALLRIVRRDGGGDYIRRLEELGVVQRDKRASQAEQIVRRVVCLQLGLVAQGRERDRQNDAHWLNLEAFDVHLVIANSGRLGAQRRRQNRSRVACGGQRAHAHGRGRVGRHRAMREPTCLVEVPNGEGEAEHPRRSVLLDRHSQRCQLRAHVLDEREVVPSGRPAELEPQGVAMKPGGACPRGLYLRSDARLGRAVTSVRSSNSLIWQDLMLPREPAGLAHRREGLKQRQDHGEASMLE
eukprot:scaffold544_cov117-Isochrysis_galbana.AAC.24